MQIEHNWLKKKRRKWL